MPYKRTGRPPGRPPYPGPLTPAEERVLDGVRRGLSNPQIATELDVSPDAVKYHVANMLSKLGLRDRHALAEWQPLEPAGVRSRWGSGILALLRRPAGIALGAAVLAGIAWLVVLTTRGGPEQDCRDTFSCAGTPGPADSVTNTPTATPRSAVLDNLRRRPRQTIDMPPGGECPVTTMSRRTLVYDPPIAPVALASTRVDVPGAYPPLTKRFVLDVPWTISADFHDPAVIRGTRIDGEGAVNFEGGGRVFETLDVATAAVPRLVVSDTGCYALQIETPNTSKVQLFEVVAAGLDAAVPPPPIITSTRPAAGGLAFTVDHPVLFPRTYLAGESLPQAGLTPAGALTPSWSPDGRLIASVGCFDDACTNSVALDAADGTDLRYFQPGSEKCNPHGVGWPSWSPDSRYLAFEVRRCEGLRAAEVQVFDTATPEDKLTALEPIVGQELTPAWSPNGDSIAFTREIDGDYDICVMRPDGSDVRCPVERAWFDAYPTWSPDGSTLLFESLVGGRRGLWLVGRDGSGLRELAADDGSAWFSAWSPDGARIAFSSDRDGDGFHIYVVDVASGTLIRGDATEAWCPKWSPDGTTIGFLATRDGKAEVYTMRPDGTDTERITDVRNGWVEYFEWVRPPQ